MASAVGSAKHWLGKSRRASARAASGMSRVCWTRPRPAMEFPVFNGTVNAALALSMTVEPASERISPRPWGRAPRPQHGGYRKVCPTMVAHRGPLAQAHTVRKRTVSLLGRKLQERPSWVVGPAALSRDPSTGPLRLIFLALSLQNFGAIQLSVCE